MSSSLLTNISSLTAQSKLMRSTSALDTTFQRLSTGLRINSAKDDAAGIGIVSRMTSLVKGYNQTAKNANDAISLVQVAQSATNDVLDSLQRMRELVVQAGNATYNSNDIQSMMLEFNQLRNHIASISSQIKFNDMALLDGSFSKAFQVGSDAGDQITMSIGSVHPEVLGVETGITTGIATDAVTSTAPQDNPVPSLRPKLVLTTASGEITVQPGPEGMDAWTSSVFYGGGQGDSQYIRVGGWGDEYHSFIKFNLNGLPLSIDKAEIQLYTPEEGNWSGNYTSMQLERVTSNWDETVKWQNPPSSVHIQALPTAADNSWYIIDITSLYDNWQNGTFANYGIMLRPDNT